MTVELVQTVVEKAVSAWWLLGPLWVIAAIILFYARRSYRSPPIWTFLATSVICLYVTVIVMFAKTAQLGRHPDDGWARMGTANLLLLVSPELASGAILLIAIPWRSAWSKRLAIPCIVAGFLSFATCAALAYYVPDPSKPPRNVEIVIPDRYRGPILINVDKEQGVPPERTWWGITRYVIPPSGKLLTTDDGPLIAWHEDYGRYASGAVLPMLDTSLPDSEGFLACGSDRNGYLMWVGSKLEFYQFKESNRPQPRKRSSR